MKSQPLTATGICLEHLVSKLDSQLTEALKTENHSHDKDKVQDALAMLSNVYDNIDKNNAYQNKKIKEILILSTTLLMLSE